ncbi:hypothetical protein [Rufibacter aurantiacus]|uniref:hypothetical protein n=1 Tax=Rufibacter aurantiacus TaxID=2817374 RepID=UPI001B30D39C|nr:hypothetical protein [Rufibacter aurantiacus]
MVRINIKQPLLDKLVTQHYRALILPPYSLFANLLNFPTTTHKEGLFIITLIKNFKKIITSKPDELQTLANLIEPLLNDVLEEKKSTKSTKEAKTEAVKEYKKNLLEIFNYKKFTTDSPNYKSYTLAEALQVDVCPYCNRQYTFTLNTKSGKTRPEFDHFFNKSTYPFFALSFYNLIPSCHICNSNLKGSTNFQNDTHLNPYVACFDKVLQFSIDVTKADFINGVKKDYTISLKPVPGADPILIPKAEENAKIFKHNLLYERHKDLVSELIQKAYYYTQSRIDELKELSDENGHYYLFKDEEEVKRFITGVYTKTSDIGKRPMSKLISDISIDLGLIK